MTTNTSQDANTPNDEPRFSWLHLAMWMGGGAIAALGFYCLFYVTSVGLREQPQQWMVPAIFGVFGAAVGLFRYRSRLRLRILVADAQEIQRRIGGNSAIPVPRFSWVHFLAYVAGGTILTVALRAGFHPPDPEYFGVERAREIWIRSLLIGAFTGGVGYFFFKRNRDVGTIDRAVTGARNPTGGSTKTLIQNAFSHTDLVAYAVGYPVLFVSGMWAIDHYLLFDSFSQNTWKTFLKFGVFNGLCAYIGHIHRQVDQERERQSFDSIDWTPLP